MIKFCVYIILPKYWLYVCAWKCFNIYIDAPPGSLMDSNDVFLSPWIVPSWD